MSILKLNTMKLKQFSTRTELGAYACNDVLETIKKLLSEKETINMIFAAAPSQGEFLDAFCTSDIDFSRINAFHMDEYIGLPKDAPQGFGCFLSKYLFSKVPFKSVNYLDGNASDPEAECTRYSNLLKENPTDIVCLGIGENGHIAFNDPDEADFNDKHLVKQVKLDEMCRNQQVNDGCFTHIDEVPTHALTLTIPALTNAKYHFCMVPAITKAQAVHGTIYNEISEKCPATILRTCENFTLYIDSDSGSLLK